MVLKSMLTGDTTGPEIKVLNFSCLCQIRQLQRPTHCLLYAVDYDGLEPKEYFCMLKVLSAH